MPYSTARRLHLRLLDIFQQFVAVPCDGGGTSGCDDGGVVPCSRGVSRAQLFL